MASSGPTKATALCCAAKSFCSRLVLNVGACSPNGCERSRSLDGITWRRTVRSPASAGSSPSDGLRRRTTRKKKEGRAGRRRTPPGAAAPPAPTRQPPAPTPSRLSPSWQTRWRNYRRSPPAGLLEILISSSPGGRIFLRTLALHAVACACVVAKVCRSPFTLGVLAGRKHFSSPGRLGAARR